MVMGAVVARARCANPECLYMVHSDPEFRRAAGDPEDGPAFCCRVCASAISSASVGIAEGSGVDWRPLSRTSIFSQGLSQTTDKNCHYEISADAPQKTCAYPGN